MVGGLPICFVNNFFNPASLTFTGWWRADYAGSPWTPTASAGSSGSSIDLTEATNPASTGAAVNGYIPADFDGIDDRLRGDAFNSYCSGPAGTVVALFYADTADAAAAFGYDDPGIITDSLNAFNLGFSDGGVGVAFYDGTWNFPTKIPCSTGFWHMVFVRWNGSVVEFAVDGGSFSTLAVGNLAISAHVLSVGESRISAISNFDGKILEVMTANVALTNSDRTNIRSYFNARYGLSL